MLGQDICLPAVPPGLVHRTLSAHTVICLLLITECSLRLPYSDCTAFLFGIILKPYSARTTHPFLLALRSPFGLISSAAIPPPAALCRRRDKTYSSSSTVYEMISQSIFTVKSSQSTMSSEFSRMDYTYCKSSHLTRKQP